MSNKTRELLAALKEGAAEAAKTVGGHLLERIKEMPGEVAQEGGRLAEQGKAEIASVLFTGSGYVPYGQGQMLDTGKEEEQREQERGGREM